MAELTNNALQQEEDDQKNNFMTFRCGEEYYGIEICYVVEILTVQKITEVPETEHYIKGLINMRGKIVPVIDVRRRFGKEELEYNDRTCIIVIHVRDQLIGLIVDTIAEVVNIEKGEVAPPPHLENGRAGDYVMGIGKVGDEVKLLLDPEKLLFDE